MDSNVVRIATAGDYPLSQVSDDDLLQGTRRLVGQSNRVLAALLAHLSEVEARGLHRLRACASLYTYCIYELRMSEDTAYRRVAASRLVRRVPALIDAVERGELHLTGLLLLGPHLTEENAVEVLARAKHRTKKEILGLVRQLSPMPDVPSRVEPLGPAPRSVVRLNPSWEQFVGAMCPVRGLPPGERPSDWLESALETSVDFEDGGERDVTLPAPARSEPPERNADDELAHEGFDSITASTAQPSGRQRYKVQFTANEEYVALLDEAKDLLALAVPSRDIAEVHLRAMRVLVAELKKRKYAVKPPRAQIDSAPEPKQPEPSSDATATASTSDANTAPTAVSDRTHFLRTTSPQSPLERGRHVPAAVRRAVFARDAGRCAYVDARGERCRETARLEFHHHEPFAIGGQHGIENLSLRCAQHNALAAEQDFGRDLAIAKRHDTPHFTWRTESHQALPDDG